MRRHRFGRLGTVSALSLGGGGLGMLWGQTTVEECVATVHASIAAGITLLDMAPRYGDGLAERIIGEAFAGRLPEGVRVSSKCNLGDAPPDAVEGMLRASIEASLARMRIGRLDLFFLHSNIVPDRAFIARRPAVAERLTPYATFADAVRPALERLAAEGLIGAWGLTGIGEPGTLIRVLGERPAPASVQCIANLLDSAGSLTFFDGPARPREIIAAARASDVAVMGIRAAQAGALTAALDRPLPADHPEARDYARAAGFRRLAAELGADPAVLAHRYALGLDIDTLVLGVKNRAELAACVAAAEAGALDPALMARIEASVGLAAHPPRA